MPRNYTVEIDGDEYIGESLVKINDNFFNLDNLQQTLSSVTGEVAAEASLALTIGAQALTGIRDINLRLADRGAFQTPHAFYVSVSGRDMWPGTVAQPYATIDKAINELTTVAKYTPRDPSTINKISNYYIILKENYTFSLSSDVTFGGLPGTVHIVGMAPSPVLSAIITKPSNTVHTPFDSLTSSSEFAFETTQAQKAFVNIPSVKVFQTFGKNVIPVPGYANYTAGTRTLTGFNSVPFTKFLSAIGNLQSSFDDRYYNYILVGTEVKEIESIVNDSMLNVTTNFTESASGAPIFLGNRSNYYYSFNETYQQLSADTRSYDVANRLASYNLDSVTISAGHPTPFAPGQTKFETSNLLHYNNNISLIVNASSCGSTRADRVHIDNTGTLLTDKYLSKTQLAAADTSVQGYTGYIPYFAKTLYELYRGVYDITAKDTLSFSAAAYNYDNPTPNNSFFDVINRVRIPRGSTIKMPTPTGRVYVQGLPTTILFANSASAGFKLDGTNLHLHNVYIRGPRPTGIYSSLTAQLVDTFDTRNIGIQARNNSTVFIDSDCAIANFSIGLHADNNSHIVVTGDTASSIIQQNALTVTDNTVGVIIENNSALETIGPRLIVSRNFRDAIIVRNSSKLLLQHLDLLHNGGTALMINNDSYAGIGNVCIIGNRYGIDCSYSSKAVITPELLASVPVDQPYAYYSPNFIYCNSIFDANAAGVNIKENSHLVLEHANVVKSSLTGVSINLEDTSSGVINYTNVFGTYNNMPSRPNNLRYSVGISTSKNSNVLNNTSIYTAQTGLYVKENATVAAQGIYIDRAGAGIVLTHNNNVSLTLTNYPTGNNVINSTNTGISYYGSNNILTFYGEITDFRNTAAILLGINNYGAFITDNIINGRITSFITPTPNTADTRDNKVKLATYPRRNLQLGQPGVIHSDITF